MARSFNEKKWKRNDKQNIIAGKQNVIRYGIAEITGCRGTSCRVANRYGRQYIGD